MKIVITDEVDELITHNIFIQLLQELEKNLRFIGHQRLSKQFLSG